MGVGAFDSCEARLRASAMPAESIAAKSTMNVDGKRRAMKQPLIEGDAIACQRAIRLADCVVAKLIICYLMALTN